MVAFAFLMSFALQLCRPLPGAVTWNAVDEFAQRRAVLQLCRPLPGAVTLAVAPIAGGSVAGFNCAAPFRGRLLHQRIQYHLSAGGLQLCRPLPGAVTTVGDRVTLRCAALQLCRAPVAWPACRCGRGNPALCGASIVPPPSGGGYMAGELAHRILTSASIVPPPSGGGYPAGTIRGRASLPRFNCAAPFRGRLRGGRR